MREKDVLSVSSKDTEIFNEFLKSNLSKIDELVSNSNNKYSGLKKIGIYDKGFSRIEKGYSEVGASLNNYRKVLNEYYDEVISQDKKYSDIMDLIKIPNDFSLNGFVKNNGEFELSLNKNEGKSVNDGTNNGESGVLDLRNNFNRIDINSILNEETNKLEYDDNSHISKQENLKDINNGTIEEKINYNSDSVIENKILKNINKDDNSDSVQYDDKTTINYANINSFGDLSNKESKKIRFQIDENGNIKIVPKELLEENEQNQ